MLLLQRTRIQSLAGELTPCKPLRVAKRKRKKNTSASIIVPRGTYDHFSKYCDKLSPLSLLSPPFILQEEHMGLMPDSPHNREEMRRVWRWPLLFGKL